MRIVHGRRAASRRPVRTTSSLRQGGRLCGNRHRRGCRRLACWYVRRAPACRQHEQRRDRSRPPAAVPLATPSTEHRAQHLQQISMTHGRCKSGGRRPPGERAKWARDRLRSCVRTPTNWLQDVHEHTTRRRRVGSVNCRGRRLGIALIVLMVALACTRKSPSPPRRSEPPLSSTPESAAHAVPPERPTSESEHGARDSIDDRSYEGVDSRGIPHYALALQLSPDDARVLRQAYGIEDPHRLYLSDSTEEGMLKYDTQVKRCSRCYVNSYRVGYVSVRRPEESWEDAERRVEHTPARVFTGGPIPASRATADLDPDVRPLAEAMLNDAHRAGFRLNVIATYRSPLREAFLMAEGGGRTHTLTSNHSYGRALDIVVDDGNRAHPATKRDWVAFRRWLTAYRTPAGESFRMLGPVDHSWDWPHVELPSSRIGFATIQDAIARGRACLAPRSIVPCNFAPKLPAALGHPLVR